MFSRTTTASSMRMPITSDSAISDIMLKVKPATYMKKNVAMTEVGSASAVMSVERQSRMNRKMTSTAMMPPKRMWLRTSRTFSLMKSASLWTGRICRSGNDGPTRASIASTRSVISTVLAPDCLRTENDTASAPFSRVVVSRSSKPSTTVPTSRTRTVEPPSERRMTSAISSAPLNSPLVRSVTLRPSRSTLPPGRSRFSAASLAATSVIGMPIASSRRGIEVDLDLADLAAVDLHRGDAVDLLEQRLQLFVDLAADPVRRLRRADRVDHHRQRGDVEALDGRVFDVGRQRAADGGDLLADLGGGRLRDRLRAAVRRRRARSPSVEVEITRFTPLMPETASSTLLRDQRLDFFRRGAGEHDADVDEGEVDLRKEVDAEPSHRHQPEHDEAQDDHGREDRALD